MVDKGEKKKLSGEQAFAVPYTNRTPWADFSILQRLSPEKLAAILRDVRSGECPAEYLELAQDMEMRDLHYRSVLSTRKDAVCGLEIKVEPASNDKRDIEIAKAVENDIIQNRSARFIPLVRDMLDALAKGFSVTEIVWDTAGKTWKPSRYKWRDPRWFRYDKETGQTLMLRDRLTAELHPLQANKFIIHEPHLLSGTQIAGGLALPALFYFMLKSYDVTSWAAFIDRYGFPIRLAKYGKKATEDDIKTLRRAVASLGADFGAVVPESVTIEIIESKTSSENSQAYQTMATWIDKQISKLVLGQTMTTDDGSSRAQSEVHEEVRQDIAAADALAVADTFNTMLVVPYVNFNFGEQERYPEIVLYKPDKQNIEQVVNAIEKLTPHGLTVKAEEIRSMLGLSKPEKDDEIIGGIAPLPIENEDMNSARPELNSVSKPCDLGRDQTADLESDFSGDFIPISDEIAEVLEKASSKAVDFDSFKAELERIAADWSPDKIAELMAVAFFSARAKGDSKFAG
ncbi:MAG: DUF935 domain-containing protein [Bacteroides sp.]|nr:DUF935 domain-containing protein [Prevotella sp.]MCM1407084.1 DUF935 domain-containing protein [Treponema brennaborense]MCM1470236.1 DUF935 domain-containing protein [Bacteroides sp.]